MHLLLDAGNTRYAIEATRVLEIAEPDHAGLTLHGHHQLRDLSRLLGGPPEQLPGTAVVLDVSPTTAVRVKSVREVVDLSQAQRHTLPRKLLASLEPVVTSAIAFHDELFFELDVEAAARGLESDPPALVARLPIGPESERSLVFESQGRRLAVPLSLVSQIVPAGRVLCALPHEGPLKGVILHQQHLWPTWSLPGLLGGASLTEELAILLEVQGEGLGLLASAAFGVRLPGQLEGAEVIDLTRLFS